MKTGKKKMDPGKNKNQVRSRKDRRRGNDRRQTDRRATDTRALNLTEEEISALLGTDKE